MVILITLGTIYTSIVIFSFVKRDWPTIIRKSLILGHFIFAGLMVMDIVLLLTSNRTFTGIYSDRIVFWGLLLTGGLFFSLFKGKGLLTTIYFGIYLYYPLIAMTTFLMDRIMFVVVASPILISLMLPETYYKDNKFEIRSNTGIMAPRQIILIEKGWLTEKQIGQTEYGNRENLEVRGIEIVSITADSINARLDYGQRSEGVTFKTSR